jgi:hypothetical protein
LMDIGCAGIPDNKLSGKRALRKGGAQRPPSRFSSQLNTARQVRPPSTSPDRDHRAGRVQDDVLGGRAEQQLAHL